jgi:diguanylate cyclase (GGDEF)-like protein/PAS domain S-box-containing protein
MTAHHSRADADTASMGSIVAARRDGDSERRRLESLARYDVDLGAPDPLFDQLATLAAGTAGTPFALITIVDEQTQWLLGAHGLGAHGLDRTTVQRDASFCTHTIDAAQAGGVTAPMVLQISDTLLDPRTADSLFVLDAPHIRFYAGVPLISRDGAALGTICVLDTEPRALSAERLSALQSLAGVAVAALETARHADEIQAAELRFRSLLDTTPTGIVVLRDTEVCYANAALARMLGEPGPAVLIGTDLARRCIDEPLLPAPDEGLFNEAVPAADWPRYWRLRTADGGEVAVEVSHTSIVWAGERAEHVELRDVSAAVAMFGELSDSESRYRQLADNSTDMMTLHAPDGGYLFVSLGSLLLTGYSPAEVEHQGYLDLVHPDDLVGFLDSHIQAHSAGVDRFTVTYRLRHRDGSWVPVESIVRLLSDTEGNLVEFQCNTRDITERVLVEQSRELADRQFRVAMDNAPIGMGLLSLGGRFSEVNRALCQLFGLPESELLAGSLDALTHPDSTAAASGQLAQLVAGDADSLELEMRYRRGDGDYVWALRTVSLVRTHTGEPSYLVVQIQDITAWKTVEETLSRQALSDPLTGLANRLMLTQRLTHALVAAKRRRTSVGLVFIDLDRFKAINDSLGHEAGDSILKQVAERLARSIREEDTAVRLGGDEFVVLCEDLGGLADLRLVAGRIDAALAEPYRLGERAVHMTASIGLSVAAEDDAESLLRHSDAAMYEAKRRGRGRTEIYDPTSHSDSHDALTVEQELHRAVAGDELRVHYQPVVSILNGSVIAHEALVRWQHPTRGLLAPVDFLTVAEDGPLILAIGEWVLRRACADTAQVAGTDIGVNVSPRQLNQPGFAELVAEILTESGLDPRRLILEITETSILHASATVLAATAAITALGVRFALDDFGTGQSSLSSLQRLPISFLKIDRSFTSQIGLSPSTERLITGILRLAASMGLSVVAEGVEELEQAEFLQAQGCTDAQGYLYGRPVPL